jgi:hypothetical protein
MYAVRFSSLPLASGNLTSKRFVINSPLFYQGAFMRQSDKYYLINIAQHMGNIKKLRDFLHEK